MIVVVVYDISNNKKRRKLVKLLEAYGERVQESVFECVLNQPLFYELKNELQMFKLKNSESIIVYTIKSNKYLEKWRKEDIKYKYHKKYAII